MTNQPELAIEKPRIWIEMTKWKERLVLEYGTYLFIYFGFGISEDMHLFLISVVISSLSK